MTLPPEDRWPTDQGYTRQNPLTDQVPVTDHVGEPSLVCYRLAAGVLWMNCLFTVLDLFFFPEADRRLAVSISRTVVQLIVGIALWRRSNSARQWAVISAFAGAAWVFFQDLTGLGLILATTVQWSLSGALLLLLMGIPKKPRVVLAAILFVALVLLPTGLSFVLAAITPALAERAAAQQAAAAAVERPLQLQSSADQTDAQPAITPLPGSLYDEHDLRFGTYEHTDADGTFRISLPVDWAGENDDGFYVWRPARGDVDGMVLWAYQVSTDMQTLDSDAVWRDVEQHFDSWKDSLELDRHLLVNESIQDDTIDYELQIAIGNTKKGLARFRYRLAGDRIQILIVQDWASSQEKLRLDIWDEACDTFVTLDQRKRRQGQQQPWGCLSVSDGASPGSPR